MPSEQIIGEFALRGYRGAPVFVSAAKYFNSTKLSSFTDHHVRDMAKSGWPVAKRFVEQDVLALEQLAEQCDAVRVIPTR